MSAKVASAPRPVTTEQQEHVDKRLDLASRFLQAGIADPTRLPKVPEDAVTYLLPDDDPAFVEQELAAAADSARRGRDVHLHRVHVADLPELATEPSGPPVGLRRTFFEWDGSIASQELCGPDGEWHKVEPPEPVDE